MTLIRTYILETLYYESPFQNDDGYSGRIIAFKRIVPLWDSGEA